MYALESMAAGAPPAAAADASMFRDTALTIRSDATSGTGAISAADYQQFMQAIRQLAAACGILHH